MKTKYVNEITHLRGGKKKLPVVKYEVGTRMWPGGDCKAFQRA